LASSTAVLPIKGKRLDEAKGMEEVKCAKEAYLEDLPPVLLEKYLSTNNIKKCQG